MRLLVLITLSACAPPLFLAERQHCLYSLECEQSERCIQQRCVKIDAGNTVDAGPVCEDPDTDGANLDGLVVQSEETHINRHVCPQTPDRYINQLTTTAQVQSWALCESGPAPILHLLDPEEDLPESCEPTNDRCAQGGRLTGLNIDRVEDRFKLTVVAPEDRQCTYEFGVRVGRPCEQQSDCGTSARCVRAIAERPDQVGTSGICVFSRDVAVPTDCDRNDRSSEHPESAPDSGVFGSLELQQVPLCQHDNDWYSVTVEGAGDLTKEVQFVSTAAQNNELSAVSLFFGLYSAVDLRPIRFVVLYFPSGVQTQSLTFSNISAGEYKLRVTQINTRQNVSTYSVSNP